MRKWGTILGLAVVIGALMFLSGHEPPPVAPGPEEPEAAGPAAGEEPDPQPEEASFPPPPAPRGPHTFEGRVTWADGSPFAGTIELLGHAWPVAGDGAFSIPGLDARLHEFRVVHGADFRSERRRVWIPEESPLEVVLGEGYAALSGRVVVAATDRPVPGRAVVARCVGPDPAFGLEVIVRTKADEAGAFRMRVPSAPGQLEVNVPGFVGARLRYERPREGVEIRLLPAAGVSGTVRRADTNDPVPGVLVFAIRPGHPLQHAPTTTSDGDGRYAIEGLPHGTHNVLAAGGGFVSAGLPASAREDGNPFLLILEPGESRRLDIEVVPAVRVEGRVLDATGKGVAEARVRAVPRTDLFGPGANWARASNVAVTGADGSFRLSALLPGLDYEVLAALRGGWFAEPVTITAPASGTVPVELRVAGRTNSRPAAEPGPARGLAVVGRAILPDGSPASHGRARVRAAVAGKGTASAQRYTGPSGYFRIEGLLPGAYRLTAETVRDGHRYVAEKTVEAGGRSTDLRLVEVVSTRAKRVAVRVLGPDGRPVIGGVLCWTTVLSGDWNSRERPLHGGRAVVPVGNGRHYVEVRGARDATGRRLGSILEGPFDLTGEEWTIRLGEERTLSGRVVGPDGGVPGLRVAAWPAAPLPDHAGVEHAEAYTDRDGRFTIRGLGAFSRSVYVAVTPEWAPLETVEVDAGRSEVTIRLRPAARVVLTFLDSRNAPVPEAEVEVEEETEDGYAETAFSGTSDARGRVVVTGLSPERRYRLYVSAPEGRSDLWPAYRETDHWSPGDMTFRFRDTRVLRGRITDERDRPVPGANVFLRTDEGAWDWVVESGERGEFTTDPVPVGEVRLAASPPGESEPDAGAALRVIPEGADRADLRVTMGAEVFVRVTDWPANQASQAHLIRESDGEVAGTTRIHEDGVVRFGRLSPGERYGVWAECFDGVYKIVHLTGLEPGPKPVTTRLKPARAVAGRVVHPLGLRANPVHLRLTGPGFRSPDIIPRHDDRFEFRCVPGGVLTLTVSYPVDKARVESVYQVRGGDTDLEIKVGK